jgi:hypothetical protein
VKAKASDISYSQRVGPVAGEHFEAPWVFFDLDERLDTGTVEAKLEAAAPGEETDGTHGSSIMTSHPQGALQTSSLHNAPTESE